MSQPMGTSGEMVEFDMSSNGVDRNADQISTQSRWRQMLVDPLELDSRGLPQTFFSRLLSVVEELQRYTR